MFDKISNSSNSNGNGNGMEDEEHDLGEGCSAKKRTRVEEKDQDVFNDDDEEDLMIVYEAILASPPKKKPTQTLRSQQEMNELMSKVLEQDHLLENILFQLPIRDLLLNASLVCSRWADIINRGKFVPWKKAYHLYALRATLSGEEPAVAVDLADHLRDRGKVFKECVRHVVNNRYLYASQQQQGEEEEDNWKPGLILPFLIGYSSKMFSQDEAFLSPVLRHSRIEVAKTMVRRCLGDQDEQCPPSALIVSLCVAARDAWDVVEVIRCFSASNRGDMMKLMEVLHYCAVAFKFCQRNHGLPIRYHFSVIQAIFFFENNSDLKCLVSSPTPTPSPIKRQLTLPSMGIRSNVARAFSPTSEQAAIINHRIDPEVADIVKVVAFAGTGKTTTLVKLTERNPHLRFLVIMYNKSVKETAERTFPKANVVCSTAHSLAYQACARPYVPIVPNLKAKFIMWQLDRGISKNIPNHFFSCLKIITSNISEEQWFHTYKRAGLVVATLNKFLCSPDTEVTSDHVPLFWREAFVEEVLSDSTRRDAQMIWEKMRDPKNTKVRMTHDGYLKLWQLTYPNLQEQIPHDVLLVDEGQDMNPAMLDVFRRQNTNRFIVGDPHQQIYVFRGAVNALERVDCTHTYHLTQSFRFGPQVAFAANCCLDVLKGQDRWTLFGGRYVDRLVNEKEQEKKPRMAIIGRTNRGLLDQAIRLICTHSGPVQRSGHFQGGISSYNLDEYVDLLHLKRGRKEKMKDKGGYKRYESYKSLVTFATGTDDLELLGKIHTVDYYGDSIIGHVEKLKLYCKSDNNADFIFTTTHKAKGLEWDDVALLDDFVSAFLPGNQSKESRFVFCILILAYILVLN